MSQFLQYMVAGVALGAKYALVALGFVIIFKATGVINFAQGGLVMLGAYLTYNFGVTWDLPFWVAVAMAMVVTALVGVVIERVILRYMVGRPAFALIMITVGLLFILQQVTVAIWGDDALNLGDPWGLGTFRIGDIVIQERDLWAVILAAAAVAVFFVFFRYSSLGLAMRATAIDQEAALAQGMSAKRVHAAAWAIAGATGALAGVTIAAGSASLDPSIQFIALLAFPAIILGGIDSPLGAVVGGLVIGITQSLTNGYQAEYLAFLGSGFQSVMPFVVMVLVLLVRPYGLFGTPEVKRV
ncbi:MAG: branched-chain amino acid ABC transporter permease [Acidimicrobiia bacterium]|nr:branched-chain amino acid ABC transporter permease [Acidimicrobiia bacterium]